jgi:hypothetical protein
MRNLSLTFLEIYYSIFSSISPRFLFDANTKSDMQKLLEE